MVRWSDARKLSELRQLMAAEGVDGYVIPSEDSHQSEYPLQPDRRREYISGFTGSAGYALVTTEHAYLWTDGRYFLQAEKQLAQDQWTLCKQKTPACPVFTQVVKAECKRLGFDPFVHNQHWADATKKAIADSAELVPVYGQVAASSTQRCQKNLVDEVWNAEGVRPAYPNKPLRAFESGQSVQDKLTALRALMKDDDLLVIANLSQIAWLLNLRGADVDCSRIFLAYCVVSHDNVQLYLKNSADRGPVPLAQDANCELKDYDHFLTDLHDRLEVSTRVWLDSDVTVGLVWLAQSRSDHVRVAKSPLDLMKAKKNPTELEGMRMAHVEDGLALSMALCWLETADSLAGVTEWTVAEQLRAVRSSRPGFECLSFESIVGVDDNGAVIHYAPKPESCRMLNPLGMLLIDSGAHYSSGTTDVTRTLHLGKPSDLQRELYTRVLMGHLDLAGAIFPASTHGCVLDTLARRHLWAIGFNYLHGTGHGVGHSLEVHEAPPNISNVCPPSTRDVCFEPGMVVSNEPGAYLDGHFGIRIESLIYCHQVSTPYQFNQDSPYLGFTDLTLVPHCKKLIKKSLMSSQQIDQLNDYHTRVYNTLWYHADREQAWGDKHPLKISKSTFVDWLARACSPL